MSEETSILEFITFPHEIIALTYLIGVAEFGRAEARHDARARGLRDVLRLAAALGQQRRVDGPEQDGLGEALSDDARVVLHKSRLVCGNFS